MNIRCAEDHLVVMQDETGRAPLKNCIKEMVSNELFLEQFLEKDAAWKSGRQPNKLFSFNRHRDVSSNSTLTEHK